MAINPNDITTKRVGELPTDTLATTSKFAYENGTDLFQGSLQDLIDLILPLVTAFTGEYRFLQVAQSFITDNFDETGLGINLCVGWAIPNGNNGTTNINGRIFMPYGTTYSTLGFTGGSATHTLTIDEIPSHSHQAQTDGGSTNSSGPYFRRESDSVGFLQTEATGGGQAHNNLQPFIVTLIMVKI